MTRRPSALLLPALFVIAAATARATSALDIVDDVRAAIASGGLSKGEETLALYRTAHGVTAESLQALCWLARSALADKLFDKAHAYAQEARTAAEAVLGNAHAPHDSPWLNVVESAAGISADALFGQGARSEAVYLLRNTLATYRDTSIQEAIQANLELLSLEGRSAPPLDPGVLIGPKLQRPGATQQPQLVFFWAHWCQDCKAESPILARIAEKYRARGLTIVGPTRRYGYVQAGRPAAPDRELRHILQVRDSSYRFLRDAAVPVTDANYRTYGVAAVPMHVLIDRSGVVRLYQQGRMTEEELDAAIARVLQP